MSDAEARQVAARMLALGLAREPEPQAPLNQNQIRRMRLANGWKPIKRGKQRHPHRRLKA